MEKGFLTFDSNQSLIVLFFAILFFLLGLLAGYFLRQRRVREMRKTLDENELMLQTSAKNLEIAQHELDLLKADLAKSVFETGEFKARANRHEEELQKKNTEFIALQQENQRLKSANEAFASNIEDLNHQILGLKVRASSGVSSDQPVETTPALADSIERLEAMVVRLGRMEAENTALKAALAEALERAEVLRAALPASTPTLTFDIPEATEPPLVFKRETAAEQAPIATPATDEPADDLTRIEGIGPFIARLLQQQGVSTFAQISRWTDSDIEHITKAIGYFPGRIARDNWVGQAKVLAGQPSEGV